MLRASLSQGLSRLHVLSLVLPQLYGAAGPAGDVSDVVYGEEYDDGSDDEDGPSGSESDEEQQQPATDVPNNGAVSDGQDSDLDSSPQQSPMAAAAPMYVCVCQSDVRLVFYCGCDLCAARRPQLAPLCCHP